MRMSVLSPSLVMKGNNTRLVLVTISFYFYLPCARNPSFHIPLQKVTKWFFLFFTDLQRVFSASFVVVVYI